jgi:hypothetical protein
LLEKITEPVELSLVRAPILTKKEISDFFGLEENEFEIKEQGKNSYKITVKNGEIGINMFNTIKHKFVSFSFNT